MAKKAKEEKSKKKPAAAKKARVEDIKPNAENVAAITITETEEDIVLAPGFNGDENGLKEEIKKEAAKSDVINRFLIPLFTFIVVGLIAGGLTWYYARPEITNEKTNEEKIENAPQVKEQAPTTTTPAPAATTTPQPTTYTVKSGDTLSSIANANGLTSKQLADYNGITNADSLTIGQVLKLPPK